MWFFKTDLKFSNSRWKRLLPWLLEIRKFWLVLVVCASAVGLAKASLWLGIVNSSDGSECEDLLRVVGWVLDVLGISIAVFGIERRLNRFGGRSIIGVVFASAVAWIKRFPFYSPVLEFKSDGDLVLTTDLKAHGRFLPNRETIEERIAWLEKREDELTVKFFELQNLIEQNDKKSVERVEKLRAQLVAKQVEDQNRAGRVIASDAGWEIVGLFLILVGITLSTIPDVVASLFR